MRQYKTRPFVETEKGIQTAIENMLWMLGYYVMRLNSGKIKTETGMIRLQDPGTPDLLAFKQRPTGMVLVFVEVKRPGKKPTPLQEMKMAHLKEFGAYCFVASDPEELKERLKRIE